MTNANDFRAAAEAVIARIPDGATVGLGTGKASSAFINILGEKVRNGFKVRGIPTSDASDQLARKLGIPLTHFDETPELDVAVDGADEVDPHGQLIKGYGGALLREKVVAATAKKFFVLVGQEKKVQTLGEHGKLPVEVVPFSLATVLRKLRALGCDPVTRKIADKHYRTDNGNCIVDCGVPLMTNPGEWESRICAIPGVVDTGLFLNMATVIFIQSGDQVEIREYTR